MFKRTLLGVFLLSLAATCAADSDKNVLLDMFLQSLKEGKFQVPLNAIFNPNKESCIETCVPDWSEAIPRTTNSVEDIWNNVQMDRVCAKVDSVKSCLMKRPECSNHWNRAIGSLISIFCVDHNAKSALPCLRDRGLDIWKECNGNCSLQDSVDQVSQQSKAEKIKIRDNQNADMIVSLPNAEPLCNSSLCFMDCLNKKVKEFCAVESDAVADTIFKSLFRIESQEEKNFMLNGLQTLLTKIIPEECRNAFRQKNIFVETPNSQDSPLQMTMDRALNGMMKQLGNPESGDGRSILNFIKNNQLWGTNTTMATSTTTTTTTTTKPITTPTTTQGPTTLPISTLDPVLVSKSRLPITFNDKRATLSCRVDAEDGEHLFTPTDFRSLVAILQDNNIVKKPGYNMALMQKFAQLDLNQMVEKLKLEKEMEEEAPYKGQLGDFVTLLPNEPEADEAFADKRR